MREPHLSALCLVAFCLLSLPWSAGAAPKVPIVVCPRVPQGPVMDGKLSPGEWASAGACSDFVLLGGGGLPRLQTRAYTMHTTSSLFVAAEMSDDDPTHLVANVRERDGKVYEDDSLELFVDVDGTREHYAHFIVNSIGAKYDEYDHDVAENFDWNVVAVVNDDGWSVEIELAFDKGVPPAIGESWNIGLCRNAVRAGELSTWGRHERQFHEPQAFGTVLFGGTALSAQVTDLGDRLLGDNVALLTVTNLSSQPADAKLNVAVVGTDRRGGYFSAIKQRLPARQEAQVQAPYKVRRCGPATLQFSLTDASGKTVWRSATYPIELPAVSDVLDETMRALALSWKAWATIKEPEAKESLRLDLEKLQKEWSYLDTQMGSAGGMPAIGLAAIGAEAKSLKTRASAMQERIEAVAAGVATEGTVGLAPVSSDVHVFPDTRVETAGSEASLTACRNEWRSLQIVINPFGRAVEGVVAQCGPLTHESGARIAEDNLQLRLVDYVPAVSHLEPSQGRKPWPDVLRPLPESFTIPAGQVRALWLTVHVPADATPGLYRAEVRVRGKGLQEAVCPVALEVSPVSNRPPGEWGFDVDFWQSFGYLERHLGKKTWSEEWWQLVEVYLQDMASHGQSVCQVGAGHITSRRQADGSFEFGFERFDRYVELCRKVGIRGPIEYLQMFDGRGPTQVRFVDADGRSVAETSNPGDALFDDYWHALARALLRHCQAKGWAEALMICPTDEPQDVYGEPTLQRFKHCVGLLKDISPIFKITVALDSLKAARELAPFVDRFVFKLRADVFDRGFAQELLAQGKRVETYICCHPDRPNTFITSDAVEPVVIGWLSFREQSQGLLRWSYTNWPQDVWTKPEGNGDYAPGDLYIVYPDARGPIASTRWERLREGFQDWSLLRLLAERIEAARKAGDRATADALSAALEQALVTVCGPKPGELTAYTTSASDLQTARAQVVRALGLTQ